MITHWNFLLALGLAMFGYALARPDPYLSDLNPKADIPGEELYNELVGEVQKLHSQEVNYLQHLGAIAASQQRQEELIHLQQKALEEQVMPRHRRPLQPYPEEQQVASLLEDSIDSPTTNSNRGGRLQEPLKPLPYQKAKDEKKSTHPYMSLCHFKLCNMGRKRNTRFLHFWK